MRLQSVKKLGVFFLSATILSTSFVGSNACPKNVLNYKTALKDSILFYDANKCGSEVDKNNVFDWRGPCHLDDGKSVGLDLTGGFHDAGDHVKYGITQGYSASVLGWSLYEFKDNFNRQDKTKLLSTLKYFTDYFLKCHPTEDVFYYDVGSGDVDHQYWGAPETQQGERPVLIADSTHPASDVCGMTSAALSQMYLNYKNIDRKYANKCLVAAKEIYEIGRNNPGNREMNSYYPSFSYEDDLAWAAVWLYKAEKDKKYLGDVKSYIFDYEGTPKESFFNNKWTMCWSNMDIAVMTMMAQISKDKMYKDAVEYNLKYWKEEVPTTEGGLKFLNQWGPLKYSASEAFIALVYYKTDRDRTDKAFAKSQIDYILGQNPSGMSYVVGFGDKYPVQPHHRAASGTTEPLNQEAKYLLTGALVGGPDQNDNFDDSTNNYIATDVTIDSNAALVGAIAGISKCY